MVYQGVKRHLSPWVIQNREGHYWGEDAQKNQGWYPSLAQALVYRRTRHNISELKGIPEVHGKGAVRAIEMDARKRVKMLAPGGFHVEVKEPDLAYG